MDNEFTITLLLAALAIAALTFAGDSAQLHCMLTHGIHKSGLANIVIIFLHDTNPHL